MASDTVATAKIGLEFDSKTVTSSMSEVEKTTESKLSKVGSTAKSVASGFAKAFTAATATATAAVVAFSKSSIDAYNTQAEVIAKLDQVAKNNSWAETATQDLMAYNSEIQKYGIIGDEVTAAGQAQLGTFALSAEAIKTLTPAMDDLIAATSGYNATTDNAASMANLLGKVMTGSTSALTRYGVTLTEAQEKLIKEGDEMQRASVLAEVLENNYGGFNKALAETPQGKIKQLSNAFGDLKETWGGLLIGKNTIDEFMDNLTNTASMVVEIVPDLVGKLAPAISQIINALATKLPEILKELLPALIGGVSSLISAVAESLPALLTAITDSLVSAAPMLLNTAVDLFLNIVKAIPIVINKIVENLPSMLDAIVNTLTSPEFLTGLLDAAIELLMELVNACPTIIVAMIDALPSLLDNIISWLTDPSTIKKLLEAAVKLFFALVEAVPRILGSLIGAFGNLVGSLWNGITNLFSEFAGKFGDTIGGIFKGAINGVISFIENFVNIPINAINGFIGLINGAFGWIGVNIGYISTVRLPRLAEGGIAGSGTAAIIGEAGTEAVLPLERNTDNWSGLLAETLLDEMESREEYDSPGRVINVTMNNYIDNKLDAEEIGRKMMQSIRRAA